MYLRITNGNIEYPFSLRQFRAAFPNTSFPRDLSDKLLAEYGVYPVTPTQRPPDTLTQDAVEQTPKQVNGVWTQVWVMVAVSAEEAARRQRELADADDTETVKADAFVKNFIGMTPAQVTNYVTNNTASLTQTRALLIKMALMLLALARREFR